MIKANGGKTIACGTKAELLKEFSGTAEDEWVEAEKKATAKKGAVKATVLEADDLDGMLEWLKGELENLEEQCDD